MKTGIARASLATLTLLGATVSARAAENNEPPTPRLYASLFCGTTLTGPQRDISPALAVGVGITESIYLELGASRTYVHGRRVGTSLVPALVWAFDATFYLSGRVLVGLEGARRYALAPGVGAVYAFTNGLAPFIELDVIRPLGREPAELRLGALVGVLFLF